MPRGGARPNSGPKGPFDKLRQQIRLREQVAEAQDRMTEGQIAAAAGIKYLVARNKKGGTFKHLTEEGAKAILAGKDKENEIVEEWEKLPSPQAYAYLMDQTIGKAVNVVEATVTVSLGQRIKQAQARLSGKR